MPTTLPARASIRRSIDPWMALLALSLWAISLAIMCADSGGSGDVVNALTLASP